MPSDPAKLPTETPAAPLQAQDALPPGTRFGELEILRVLGIGGFGIVYLAQDHALERKVALKEYMPGSLAGRGKGMMVSLRSGAHTETYVLGLRSFVNEARLLARFNHPSLVKVYRFWEENGTAYMVMPYLQGRTLREARRAMTEAPSEAWIRTVLDPMLDALELLHLEDVYHRDIAPDNILLPPGELPVLLDFGAARRAIGDSTQTFTAILKPSYAPIEQYAEAMQLRQGPWTDVYALGAVIFYLLRGSPPPPATARAVQDDEPLLLPEQNSGISARFLAAVEWALAIRPKDRPQSITALRDAITGRTQVPVRRRAEPDAPQRPVAVVAAEPATAWPATQPVTLPIAPSTAFPATQPHARATPEVTVMPQRPTVDSPPEPVRRRRRVGPVVVAAVVALASVGAVAAWFASGRPANEPADAVMASAPAALPASAVASPALTGLHRDRDAVAKPSPGAPRAATTTTVATAQRVKSDDRASRAADAASAALARHADISAAAPRPVPVQEEPLRTSQPVPSTAAGPSSPREACGHRVFLAMAVCMEEQCERPRFKSHPQCDRVREIVERRRRGESGG